MNDEGKIRTFKDLYVWQEGHKLVLMIYKATKVFPENETFGLIMQLRRAVVSITSNIAEGFSRITSKDKTRFYVISLGSLTEVQNQIEIAKDLSFIVNDEYQNIYKKTVDVHKLLNGIIKSTNKIKKF